MINLLDLSAKLHTLKGIGPARARLFLKLGIEKVDDLLYFFPRDYVDLTPLNFKNSTENKNGAFLCTVKAKAYTKRIKPGVRISKLPVTDGKNDGYAVFFNQPFIVNNFYKGQRLLLIGKTKKIYGEFQINSPEWIDFRDVKEVPRILPVYPLTKGLSQKIVRKTTKNVVDSIDNIEEILPEVVLKKYSLMSLTDALRSIHFPKDFNMLKKARHRLAFQEFLTFQLSLGLVKQHLLGTNRINYYHNTDLTLFISGLPFKLTSGQKKVLRDIVDDLKKDKNMNRLIQGDVGCGKTVVACAALFLAAKNGYQGAMMAPTEILAEQHFLTLKKFLCPHNIKVEILRGGMPNKEKNLILHGAKNGTVDIVVGTHALIQKDVHFNKLGMVITDEQHRFGVKQREAFIKKGQLPDVLVMSATPIPRTVALVLYSDLDISTIEVMPDGRKTVETYVVGKKMQARVYDFMAREVKSGHRAYVVCPAVEDNQLDLANVLNLQKYLKQNYSEIKTEILHGRLKPDEKDEVIERFISGQTQVVIATTVIEVGVDVANATLMIIENAERFGLAQLHQLRGRVGRSSLKSYCILISDSKDNNARERLIFLMKCHDGFEIAQKDLELRGPGEFLGYKQHGFGQFKTANMLDNIQILEQTKNLSKKILEKNCLSLPEYRNLHSAIKDTINL
ncbi:MAG: ATP-dependent DNA helicase RecG [Tepidanaerobacteraceae bacterium]